MNLPQNRAEIKVKVRNNTKFDPDCRNILLKKNNRKCKVKELKENTEVKILAQNSDGTHTIEHDGTRGRIASALLDFSKHCFCDIQSNNIQNELTLPANATYSIYAYSSVSFVPLQKVFENAYKYLPKKITDTLLKFGHRYIAINGFEKEGNPCQLTIGVVGGRPDLCGSDIGPFCTIIHDVQINNSNIITEMTKRNTDASVDDTNHSSFILKNFPFRTIDQNTCQYTGIPLTEPEYLNPEQRELVQNLIKKSKIAYDNNNSIILVKKPRQNVLFNMLESFTKRWKEQWKRYKAVLKKYGILSKVSLAEEKILMNCHIFVEMFDHSPTVLSDLLDLTPDETSPETTL